MSESQVRILVKFEWFVLKAARRAEIKSKFLSNLSDLFLKPPVGRKSSLNFSEDWVIFLRPKGGSHVRILVKFEWFVFKTARRAEIKSQF